MGAEETRHRAVVNKNDEVVITLVTGYAMGGSSMSLSPKIVKPPSLGGVCILSAFRTAP